MLTIFSQATAQEPDIFKLTGFATMNGGTTGGAGGDTLTVTTGIELQSALDSRKNNPTPLVIFVEGIINEENTSWLWIELYDISGISIIGSGPGAEFDGINLLIAQASNVIIRNLKIHHVVSEGGAEDCITILGPSHHIWIDHCELYNEFPDVDKDYYDGLLDASGNCEYLTYSWNFLHDSWKTALVGNSEHDVFDRKLTMHHNYFLNCNSRLPLIRASTGHIFNNYYKDITSTAINSRIDACVRIEHNYFENANNPWVSAYSDILGGGEIIGNILVNSPFEYSEDTHELPICTPDIPYLYKDVLHDASEVPALVMALAGVGKIHEGPAVSTKKEDPSAGIHPGHHMTLKLTPNPVSGIGNISFKVDEPGEITLTLFDMNGKPRILHHGFYNGPLSRSVRFNTAEYIPGLYTVELSSGGNRIISKLMILD